MKRRRGRGVGRCATEKDFVGTTISTMKLIPPNIYITLSPKFHMEEAMKRGELCSRVKSQGGLKVIRR